MSAFVGYLASVTSVFDIKKKNFLKLPFSILSFANQGTCLKRTSSFY